MPGVQWVTTSSQELIFYDAGNSNGKMNQTIYINQILKPVVEPWLQDVSKGLAKPSILEEDNDSGHGTGLNSMARNIKSQPYPDGLASYILCLTSMNMI